MTREEFVAVLGREPVNDDLERANCEYAGEPLHRGCGVCKAHGKPVFACTEGCFVKAVNVEGVERATP